MNKQPLHIIFGIDNHYAPYAGIFLTSILLNNWQNEIICHIGLSEPLAAEQQQRFFKFNCIYRNCTVKLYDLSEAISELPPLATQTAVRFNKSILVRLLLPDYLPPELSRILYLDCDMLCLGDLLPLWTTDLQQFTVGACAYNEKHGPRQIERLGLLYAKHYYNSGMLLIDLAKWREHQFGALALECYKRFHEILVMPDQDVLNIILQGQIMRLADCYNRMTLANDATLDQQQPGDVLLHYVNEAKPWLMGNAASTQHLYQRYVAASLWHDIAFIEPQEPALLIQAGRNACAQGENHLAAHFYGQAAQKLLALYEKEHPVEYF